MAAVDEDDDDVRMMMMVMQSMLMILMVMMDLMTMILDHQIAYKWDEVEWKINIFFPYICTFILTLASVFV